MGILVKELSSFKNLSSDPLNCLWELDRLIKEGRLDTRLALELTLIKLLMANP